jgi:hypothetical protein
MALMGRDGVEINRGYSINKSIRTHVEKKDDKNCNVQLTAIFLQRIILRLADRQISGCSAAW